MAFGSTKWGVPLPSDSTLDELGAADETLLFFALKFIYNALGLADTHGSAPNTLNTPFLTTIGAAALPVGCVTAQLQQQQLSLGREGDAPTVPRDARSFHNLRPVGLYVLPSPWPSTSLYPSLLLLAFALTKSGPLRSLMPTLSISGTLPT